MELKKCEYVACGVEFAPRKPKQRFCCDKHRVYANRGSAKKDAPRPPIKPKATVTEEKAEDAAIPKNMADLRRLCPYEGGIDRAIWISEQKSKYGIA
jgi:hypothetical protein